MLGGLLLAPVLIVHILVEHLMYAWWVITCPCSNSAHIGRTSDVCLVVITCPCSNSAHIVLIVHILAEHMVYAWWVITCPCSNIGASDIGRTSDVCLVGYYLPLF